MTTETITIAGMSCGGCVASVKKAMDRLGISDAEVEIGSAKVSYDPQSVRREQIVEAIEDAGFEVQKEK